jgi:RecB family endonuclease NucS
MAESKKPPVWQMVREAVDALGGKTTNVEVRDWILEHYPGTNTNTIQCQIIVCTVNHDSRIHYPENNKPRPATGQYDFLFRSGKGKLELFDEAAHGAWKIAEDEDGRLTVSACDEPPDDDSAGNAFAAEAHLRDYLAQHLGEVEEGLELFVDDAEVSGVEYPTPIGRIDILAVDKQGGFVVIELKVKQGPDAVAGQVLRYKNWVRCHLAHGKAVRGIIIAQHISDKVRYAIANDPEISAREYQLHLTFSNVAKLDLSANGDPSYEP